VLASPVAREGHQRLIHMAEALRALPCAW